MREPLGDEYQECSCNAFRLSFFNRQIGKHYELVWPKDKPTEKREIVRAFTLLIESLPLGTERHDLLTAA